MSTALETFRAAPVQEQQISGNPLRYRVFGEGPAVLLVHGWPLIGITYRALIEALRPHYRCYVPDLPGAGDTPWWPEITDTMGSYAAALRELVDALQLERFALIAHDSGGGAARLLAAELRQRVRSVILQNTELPGHVSFQLRLLELASHSPEHGAKLMRLMSTTALRRSPDLEAPTAATFNFQVRIDGHTYAFLTALTVFNAPLNITVEELRLESYFPLDDATEALCRRLATKST